MARLSEMLTQSSLCNEEKGADNEGACQQVPRESLDDTEGFINGTELESTRNFLVNLKGRKRDDIQSWMKKNTMSDSGLESYSEKSRMLDERTGEFVEETEIGEKGVKGEGGGMTGKFIVEFGKERDWVSVKEKRGVKEMAEKGEERMKERERVIEKVEEGNRRREEWVRRQPGGLEEIVKENKGVKEGDTGGGDWVRESPGGTVSVKVLTESRYERCGSQIIFTSQRSEVKQVVHVRGFEPLEDESLVLKVDRAVQTDDIQRDLDPETKKNLDFIRSLVKLRETLRNNKGVTKTHFSHILKNISPKVPLGRQMEGEKTPQKTTTEIIQTSFRVSPPWLKKPASARFTLPRKEVIHRVKKTSTGLEKKNLDAFKIIKKSAPRGLDFQPICSFQETKKKLELRKCVKQPRVPFRFNPQVRKEKPILSSQESLLHSSFTSQFKEKLNRDILTSQESSQREQFSPQIFKTSRRSHVFEKILNSKESQVSSFRFSPQIFKTSRRSLKFELWNSPQPKPVLEFNPQTSKEDLSSKKQVLIFNGTEDESKLEKDIPAETIGYLLREAKVDEIFGRSVEGVLMFLESELRRDVSGLVGGWKGSVFELSLRVLNQAVDGDPGGLRKAIRGFLFQVLEWESSVSVECFTEFINEFCQSPYLCFDVIHKAIELIRPLETAKAKLGSGNCVSILNLIDRSYYRLNLLRNLLEKLSKNFKNLKKPEAESEALVSVVQLWRKPVNVSTKPQCHYDSVVREWLVVLDTLVVTVVQDFPIFAEVLWECLNVVKHLITMM